MSALKTLATVGVATLAAARMTRFFTSDTLGEWVVVGPAKTWATQQEAPRDAEGEAWVLDALEAPAAGRIVDAPPPHWGWRSKLVSAFDCPYCVGQWMAALATVGVAVHRSPLTPGPVKLGLSLLGGALAMNYVTGHVSSHLDG